MTNVKKEVFSMKDDIPQFFTKFAVMWVATSKVSSSNFATPDESDVNIAFDDLKMFAIAQVRFALKKFRELPPQKLNPAIIKRIITGGFWLGADEAWIYAQKTFDETRSVVVTEQILKSAAQVEILYMGGERTAAKAAFCEIYERLMMVAVSAGISPRWKISQLERPTRENSTEQANLAAVVEAVDSGLISAQSAITLGYGVKKSSHKASLMLQLEKNATTTEQKNVVAEIKKILGKKL